VSRCSTTGPPSTRALKAEDDRTADELQAIEDHHLVSLVDGREVAFQGPMSDYDDFVIGS
jgi:hypothetical protein